MNAPTKRQLEVLEQIRSYRRRFGVAPTFNELAADLGVTRTTVFLHVVELERKRLLRRDKYKARSVEIIRNDVLPPVKRLAFPVIGEISTSGVTVKA